MPAGPIFNSFTTCGIDFELELIHRDEINVAYIMRLLAKLKDAQPKDQAKQKKQAEAEKIQSRMMKKELKPG